VFAGEGSVVTAGAEVEVYENTIVWPGEVHYGVRVNGKDLNTAWPDPDVARRNGEQYAIEKGWGLDDVTPLRPADDTE
jgi:hypothetical protein